MSVTADANDVLHDATNAWLVVLVNQEQLNVVHAQ
jgi:hypothetical protein